MESEKFDELIKRMGTGRMSRLTALRGLAGGVTAAAAGVLLAKDEAEGKKSRKAKARRRKNKRRGAQAPVYVPAPVPVAPQPDVDPYSCAGAKECPAGTGQVWDVYDRSCPCVCGAGQVMCENTNDSYKAGMCVSNKCEDGWHYDAKQCKCVKKGDGGGGGGGTDVQCLDRDGRTFISCRAGDSRAVACCYRDQVSGVSCESGEEGQDADAICAPVNAQPVTEFCGPSLECSDPDATCCVLNVNVGICTVLGVGEVCALGEFPIIDPDQPEGGCFGPDDCRGADEGGVCCNLPGDDENVCIRAVVGTPGGGASFCLALRGVVVND